MRKFIYKHGDTVLVKSTDPNSRWTKAIYEDVYGTNGHELSIEYNGIKCSIFTKDEYVLPYSIFSSYEYTCEDVVTLLKSELNCRTYSVNEQVLIRSSEFDENAIWLEGIILTISTKGYLVHLFYNGISTPIEAIIDSRRFIPSTDESRKLILNTKMSIEEAILIWMNKC